jgi:hypothetical protein
MKMRCHNVLLAKHEGKVTNVVGTPFIQFALPFDALHILVRSRHVDADCPHLVVANFACQPCFLQSPLDGCGTVFHSIGIVDEFSVKVSTCGAAFFGMMKRSMWAVVPLSELCAFPCAILQIPYMVFLSFLACETMVIRKSVTNGAIISHVLNLTLSRVMICKPFVFLNPLFFAFSVFSACHHLTP